MASQTKVQLKQLGDTDLTKDLKLDELQYLLHRHNSVIEADGTSKKGRIACSFEKYYRQNK